MFENSGGEKDMCAVRDVFLKGEKTIMWLPSTFYRGLNLDILNMVFIFKDNVLARIVVVQTWIDVPVFSKIPHEKIQCVFWKATQQAGRTCVITILVSIRHIKRVTESFEPQYRKKHDGLFSFFPNVLEEWGREEHPPSPMRFLGREGGTNIKLQFFHFELWKALSAVVKNWRECRKMRRIYSTSHSASPPRPRPDKIFQGLCFDWFSHTNIAIR